MRFFISIPAVHSSTCISVVVLTRLYNNAMWLPYLGCSYATQCMQQWACNITMSLSHIQMCVSAHSVSMDWQNTTSDVKSNGMLASVTSSLMP